MKELKEITNCELCGHENLEEVLDIGEHPLCDDLVPINSERQCTSYPITIMLCQNCLTAHQKFQIKKRNTIPI